MTPAPLMQTVRLKRRFRQSTCVILRFLKIIRHFYKTATQELLPTEGCRVRRPSTAFLNFKNHTHLKSTLSCKILKQKRYNCAMQTMQSIQKSTLENIFTYFFVLRRVRNILLNEKANKI